MAFYKYKVADREGGVKTGLVEAISEHSAMETLEEKGMMVIALAETKKANFDLNLNSLPFVNRITIKDVVIFSRQFSVMVSANVVIVQALRILIEQTDNVRFKMMISEIADEVDNGSRLSDSLSKRPKVFSDFYVSVVKSGEASGKLEEVLNYLANEMEKDYDMSAKIKGAMIYPVFILSGLIVVAVIMMVYVVPKLTAIIVEAGAELPIATKILIALSAFFTNYWWLLLILAVFGGTGLRFYMKTPMGKSTFDNLLLRIPIFGKLFQKIYLVRFCRSMNTLIMGGVTITDSLKVASDVIGNSLYQKIIAETIKEVEDGNTISGVFSKYDIIPKMVSQMIGVGEKTGKLDVILEKISDFYSREVNNLVSNLMSLMEPFIMVVMGVGVGGMVAAIIMPMYNLSSAI